MIHLGRNFLPIYLPKIILKEVWDGWKWSPFILQFFTSSPSDLVDYFHSFPSTLYCPETSSFSPLALFPVSPVKSEVIPIITFLLSVQITELIESNVSYHKGVTSPCKVFSSILMMSHADKAKSLFCPNLAFCSLNLPTVVVNDSSIVLRSQRGRLARGHHGLVHRAGFPSTFHLNSALFLTSFWSALLLQS